MSNALQNYRHIWNTKPILKTIYGDFFDRIAMSCGPGPTLEIGGGIGNLKSRLPDVWTSDIQYAPWLDLVADAQQMPFSNGVLGNIVMLDVLHHVEPVDTSIDPLVEGIASADRDPYDSNQALPTLIATKYRDRFHRLFPDLKITETKWFSLVVYPLSGGFKAWSLFPSRLAPTFLRWERAFEAAVGPVLGFRILMVIEKLGAGCEIDNENF